MKTQSEIFHLCDSRLLKKACFEKWTLQIIGVLAQFFAQKRLFQQPDRVRETAFALHRYLRHGHLEKVYENGLAHRLRKAGVQVKQQHPLQVLDEDGTALGDYLADLLVEGELIVELKACKALTDEHVAQLLGYLRGCRDEHGLLINFGSQKLEVGKYVLSEAI